MGVPEKWNPGPWGGTLRWDPRVGPKGGTLGWHPRVGPQGGTLRWDPRVRRRSIRSQLFFGIGVPKHLAIYTGKQLCWSLFLMNTGVFSCEYCEMFKSSFFFQLERKFLKKVITYTQL